MAQDPNKAPPTVIPQRVQPKRMVRPMNSDEAYIADQLVRFPPKDGRSISAEEVKRRNLCRKLAEAISNGTLQVQHVQTINEQRNFLAFAEQQLVDANTVMAALAPITLTDEQLAKVDPTAQLLLTRNPEQKTVTIVVRKMEKTPAGQMVETTEAVGAAGGPPQAEVPAASSGTSSPSGAPGSTSETAAEPASPAAPAGSAAPAAPGPAGPAAPEPAGPA